VAGVDTTVCWLPKLSPLRTSLSKFLNVLV
jgi:hypothetical protein